MTIHEARVTFLASDTAPAMGRRVLEGLGDRVPGAVLEDARLLLTEVMTNAIRHAGLDGTDPVDVLIRPGASSLAVEVGDGGRGFDLGERLHGAGWGLLLLDRLADAWSVEERPTGGTVVRFRLRIDERVPGLRA